MASEKKELITRISFLKIPMDILDETQLEAAVRLLAARKKKQQIVLLGFRDLMRARRNSEYRKMLQEAALVLPTSKAIIWGLRFLKKGDVCRYMPFEFIIKVLGTLEKIHGSIYILGAQNREQNITAGNLRDSFPGLKIVGRHTGYFPKEREEDLLVAIKKAAPTLLLAGGGLKGRDLWLFRRKDRFHEGMYFWCGECFDIFCGKKKRLTRQQWEKGGYLVTWVLKNPLRIFLLFERLYYNLLLLIYRIRKL